MKFLLIGISLLMSWYLQAQPKLKFIELDATFEQPVDMTKAQDGTDDLYITERLGRVYRYSRNDEKVRLILDLTDIVASKSLGGMVGLDFHPKFPDSSYFYVNYTRDGESKEFPVTSVVSRFTMTENDRADEGSEYVIMEIEQPDVHHNLGDVAFGPDGFLYIPSGDGSLENDEYRAGQDPKVRLGKLLRIDVDVPGTTKNYSIPPDNPFVNSEDTLDEIWSLGLRNPRQLSFDRKTDDLWIGDLGDLKYQEMNFQAAGNTGGQNYGWSCMEGSHPYPIIHQDCERSKFYDPPRFEYEKTSTDGISGHFIVGGYVYRGPIEQLDGYFFCGDFFNSTIYLYDVDNPDARLIDATPDDPISNVSCFGESNDGSMFVASYNGKVFRIEVEESTAVRPFSGGLPLSIYPNPATDRLTIEVPDGMGNDLTISLFDVSGRKVYAVRKERMGERRELYFPTLPSGMYHLRMTDGNKLAATTVVLR